MAKTFLIRVVGALEEICNFDRVETFKNDTDESVRYGFLLRDQIIKREPEFRQLIARYQNLEEILDRYAKIEKMLLKGSVVDIRRYRRKVSKIPKQKAELFLIAENIIKNAEPYNVFRISAMIRGLGMKNKDLRRMVKELQGDDRHQKTIKALEMLIDGRRKIHRQNIIERSVKTFVLTALTTVLMHFGLKAVRNSTDQLKKTFDIVFSMNELILFQTNSQDFQSNQAESNQVKFKNKTCTANKKTQKIVMLALYGQYIHLSYL